MSTLLHDLPAHAVLGTALVPVTLTDPVNGPAVDLRHGDGPVFAAVIASDLTGDTALSVSFEESADGTTWSAVDADPLAVTANGVSAACFARTKRYVRCAFDVTGADPSAAVAAVLGQQKKVL